MPILAARIWNSAMMTKEERERKKKLMMMSRPLLQNAAGRAQMSDVLLESGHFPNILMTMDSEKVATSQVVEEILSTIREWLHLSLHLPFEW